MTVAIGPHHQPNASSASPAFHAVVIGVDHHLPSGQASQVRYPNLAAAVRDATRICAYLRDVLGVPGSSIDLLTAPRPSIYGGDGPRRSAAPPPRRPSYQAMTDALRALLARAAAGDHALIYFAGHGSRAATVLPAVKGMDGLDACLVPHDISQPGAQVLRDIELAFLLHCLRQRNVFATLIIDCCHAGGTVRAGRRVRGIDQVDRRRSVAPSAFGPWDAIAKAWPGVRLVTQEPASRRIHLGPGQGLRPRGYALLAACQPGERAVEDRVAGQSVGLFTHALLEALSALGTGATYHQLHARLAATVERLISGQNPMLVGEGTRRILGGRAPAALWGVQVADTAHDRATADDEVPGRVVASRDWVLLAAGRAHGIRGGDRLTVYAEDARDGAAVRGHDGLGTEVVVVRAGTTRAVARSPARQPARVLARAGAQAPRIGDRALPSDRAFTHRDRLQRLAPPDATLRGGSGLAVRLGTLPTGYVPGRPVHPVYDTEGPTRAGSWVLLRIDNTTLDALNVVVLATSHQATTVHQLFPEPISGASVLIDADRHLAIPLRATLLPGQDAVDERLWVFATPAPLDLRWLTSAALAQEPHQKLPAPDDRRTAPGQPDEQPRPARPRPPPVDPWPLVGHDDADWYRIEVRLQVIGARG